jgi:hypothetical protein
MADDLRGRCAAAHDGLQKFQIQTIETAECSAVQIPQT